jgi:hypothetical protein
MPSSDIDLRDREPTAVWWDNGSLGYQIGYQGVTYMRVVRVPGQMSFCPWIEVYKGDKLFTRINCALVEEIQYDS